MEEIMQKVRIFRDDRDWKPFHTPENLAKSIGIEAAELLEHFQWDNEFNSEAVQEELADVLIYCLSMADVLDVSVKEIIMKKLEKNAQKYPIEKSKGNSKKYTEL